MKGKTVAKEDKDIHLKVIVNGKAVPLKADPDASLGSLVEEALDKAKVGDKSDLDRWVFTDANGQQLDKTRTLASFAFAHNAEIFLNLSAGVVG
ncbi:MAG: hypothetical protein JWQ07_4097 [Ramlibacter sp.]|nr:hypothetical protein [Ramlibacter sp.]